MDNFQLSLPSFTFLHLIKTPSRALTRLVAASETLPSSLEAPTFQIPTRSQERRRRVHAQAGAHTQTNTRTHTYINKHSHARTDTQLFSSFCIFIIFRSFRRTGMLTNSGEYMLCINTVYGLPEAMRGKLNYQLLYIPPTPFENSMSHISLHRDLTLARLSVLRRTADCAEGCYFQQLQSR